MADNQFQRPQGENVGSNLPDRGTRVGVTDTYGADLSGSATNKVSGGGGQFVPMNEVGGGCNDGSGC